MCINILGVRIVYCGRWWVGCGSESSGAKHSFGSSGGSPERRSSPPPLLSLRFSWGFERRAGDRYVKPSVDLLSYCPYMSIYRIDCVFPMFTGLPRDIVMNTLHFDSINDTETFATEVSDLLDPFFLALYPALQSLRASYIDWPNFKYRIFNLDDPTPRVPVEVTGPYFDSGSGASTIPTEVAAVASFFSAGVPGQVYQRKYNRIFFGALMPQWLVASSTNNFPRISTEYQEAMRDAMEDLQARALISVGTWVQVSNAGGTLRTLPVIGGFVDNSPDTQRRRSVDSNARVDWSV